MGACYGLFGCIMTCSSRFFEGFAWIEFLIDLPKLPFCPTSTHCHPHAVWAQCQNGCGHEGGAHSARFVMGFLMPNLS